MELKPSLGRKYRKIEQPWPILSQSRDPLSHQLNEIPQDLSRRSIPPKDYTVFIDVDFFEIQALVQVFRWLAFLFRKLFRRKRTTNQVNQFLPTALLISSAIH